MIYSKGKNIERPHVSCKKTDYVACLQKIFFVVLSVVCFTPGPVHIDTID